MPPAIISKPTDKLSVKINKTPGIIARPLKSSDKSTAKSDMITAHSDT